MSTGFDALLNTAGVLLDKDNSALTMLPAMFEIAACRDRKAPEYDFRAWVNSAREMIY